MVLLSLAPYLLRRQRDFYADLKLSKLGVFEEWFFAC